MFRLILDSVRVPQQIDLDFEDSAIPEAFPQAEITCLLLLSEMFVVERPTAYFY